MTKLTGGEILRVVNKYIGVFDGYLGDFSYRTHSEFYIMCCDLDIEPNDYDGTTRERFIKILKSQSPKDQAKILRGVLERFPVGTKVAPETRTNSEAQKIKEYIRRLESRSSVPNVEPENTSEVVEMALRDANYLIERGDARSAVGKTHTALHGYFKWMCDDDSIGYEKNASLPKLFRLLQGNHSIFQNRGPHQDKIDNIGKGLSTAIHSLNEIRNQASDAHPNDELLDVVDATLAINAMRTIFHYVEEKRSG